jgi:rieske iron-sulfur protein
MVTMDEAANGRWCECHHIDGSTRRDFLTVASTLGVDLVIGSAANLVSAKPADERPKEGDVLVRFDNDQQVPLEPKDIPSGGPPVFAWPMDLAADVLRSGSRLNKILLVRLDPATLIGVTQERAADGVVAYSAICPHAGCEVNVWVDDLKTLECSCHYSHYNPREAAAVIDGPAPRALAALPLKVVDGKLVVAKPFTARVGIVPT